MRILASLPSPLRRPLRRVASAVRNRRRRREPLVSVVVPAYDVERYLPACLDSIVVQSHARLQVIVVDDGSPDHSIDIMRAFAERDPRIEILRQANRGLSVARNAGAGRARGTYLMFVDADDTLDPDAVRTHVRSLQASGSDFSVACYQRMSSAGTWPAAWWVRDAHRVARRGTTLTASPEIQVNAVAWSKCFRRRFWFAAELWFPEGQVYEDQAVSTRAYAQAGGFDILPAVLHNWRVRDERSSISQRVAHTDDLRARLAAARASLAELERGSLGEARATRLVQYLGNDLPLSIRAAQHGDDEFWAVLRSGLIELTAGLAPSVWRRVGVQHRVAARLVMADRRQDLVRFVGLGHDSPKHSPAIVAGGAVYLNTEARHALGLAPTDPWLAFADHQLGLVTSIRRTYWTPDHVLRIEGWAYIDNVDLAGAEIEFRLSAHCVDSHDGTVVELPVQNVPASEVTAVSKHRHADYERSGFVLEIDPRCLVGPVPPAARQASASPPNWSRSWQVLVEVIADGIVRSGPLLRRNEAGSAGRLTAGFVHGLRITPRWTPVHGLVVEIRPVRCEVEWTQVVDRVLAIRVRGRGEVVPAEIELIHRRSGRRIRHALQRLPSNRAEGTIVVPEPELAGPATDGNEDRAPDRHRSDLWLVRVIDLSGTRRPAAWTRPEEPAQSATGSVRPVATRFGNLAILDAPYALLITAAAVDDAGALLLDGTVSGISASFCELRVSAPRAQASARAVPTGPDRFSVVVPLQHDSWRLGPRPLPAATYRLEAQIRSASGAAVGSDAGDMRPVPVLLDPALIAQLPIAFTSSAHRGSIRLASRGRLQVVLAPPLTDAERGARPQEELQRRLSARVGCGSYEPGSVLFRSYYGEIAGCNPRAVHEELRRRGSGHRLYWAVKDHSVSVPEGGIPIVHDSAEWYRLLHDAEFYIDNMHQPIYHRKPNHQIQVQTFHGYPFKEMGRPNWARQQRDTAHVESYLDRAKDWNFLVSPARYGTAALCESFGFGGEVLEIGYPRNDVLLGPLSGPIRTDVRERLGIGPDQTVVLYAPTFRDELSRDDFSARMVDFLDVPRLASGLGPEFVVLVRGHAFNARRAARHGSSGNVIDVTDYPDVAGLILASDAAVLDYSSLRFDYGLTGKPMVFLVPDLEQYLNWSRGSIVPYEPTAPGPRVRTTEDVLEALRGLEEVRKEHAGAYAAFRAAYLDLEDGHASERLVDRVFFS